MFRNVASRTLPLVALLLAGAGYSLGAEEVKPAPSPENLFRNPNFEGGKAPWTLDMTENTVAQFTVDDAKTAGGRKSALVKIGAVETWGIQFGQKVAALEPGKTYTFALLAKSMGEPVSLGLDVSRVSDPQGVVARVPPMTAGKDAWRELHVTFQVDEPWPKGWAARVTCNQPDVEFRLNLFRLYEGEYVASKQAANSEAVEPEPSSENLFRNPSFELGKASWLLDATENTIVKFTVDEAEAADGRKSALVKIGAVEAWGLQFGQTVAALQPGKTYTFALLAKSMGEPVSLGLDVSRAFDPQGKVAGAPPMSVSKDAWRELHVTFKVDEPWSRGWVARVICSQPDVEFRLDLFRLSEGEYVASKQAAKPEEVEPAPSSDNLFQNPSFEFGKASWLLEASENTVAKFTVDEAEAADGRKSALVKIGAVDAWGIQFGQVLTALQPGKTYTVALLAKSMGEPVSLGLDVSRAFDPLGKVAGAPPMSISKDGWRELHVTFKVDEPSPRGWVARVTCNQPDAEFRLDASRLYEGEYMASKQAAKPEEAEAAPSSDNLFRNPSFELGKAPWLLEASENTVAKFTVDEAEAADGRKSALVKIGAAEAWGVQFAQRLAALEPGKTYTFALLAKSMGEPVLLGLDVSHAFDPQGRVSGTAPTSVSKDGWRELHVTFKVDKAWSGGWTARVTCNQPDVEFRMDLFRLYEGEYVASKQAANPLERTGNLLENPSFERGTRYWMLRTSGKTQARVGVDSADAAEGRQSALISIDDVEGFGIQFSQTVGAPAPGKVYTFAVMAKATKGTVALGLEVDRAGSPFDFVVRPELMNVTGNAWKELHVTFKVVNPYPEGWLAFVSCQQPSAEFRLDNIRLYEGKYVPSGPASQSPATPPAQGQSKGR